MRSIFPLLACLALAVANSSHAAADPRMANIAKAGKLRIGVFPSFQFSRDAAGKPRIAAAKGTIDALQKPPGRRPDPELMAGTYMKAS